LKRTEPVPAGKKLRCPECGNVFAPAAPASVPATAKKPTPKAPESPARQNQEQEIFQFQKTQYDPDSDAARQDVFTPIRDRFERSARGPALIQVVRPSDWLLRTGSLICIAAVLGALWAIWPLVFKIQEVQPPDKSKGFTAYSQEVRRYKELSPEEFNQRFVYLGLFVAQFLWGAMVCVGASKMHTLDSYPLAIIGSIMAIVGPGVPAGIFLLISAINDNEPYYIFLSILLIAIPGVPMAIWCLATLRRKDVIAGFREERPEVYVGDKLLE
jgi:hypothetical protein